MKEGAADKKRGNGIGLVLLLGGSMGKFVALAGLVLALVAGQSVPAVAAAAGAVVAAPHR